MKTKHFIACLFSAALIASAADAKKTPAPATRPAALTLPADAKEIEANTYSYTDPQGKKWIYRKTPFGLVRYEDPGAAQTAAATPGNTVQKATPFGTVRYKEPAAPAEDKSGEEWKYVKVTEQGDNLAFERKSPFGVQKWTRKKSDLNDFERTAWERQKKGATGSSESK